MREEQNKILDLLAQGTITAEEAVVLLDKVKEMKSNKPQPSKRSRRDREIDNYGMPLEDDADEYDDYGEEVSNWFTELKETLQETAKAVMESLEQGDIGLGNKGIKVDFSFQSTPVEAARLISFEGKNENVKIRGHYEDYIAVEGFYRTREELAPAVDFYESDGEYTIKYDSSKIMSMGMIISVPAGIEIEELYIENRNGAIHIEDFENISVIHGKIVTSNGDIVVEEIKGEELRLETKNGTIEVTDSQMNYIDAQTRNATIFIHDCVGREIRAITSNAPVHVDDIYAENVYIRTRNARVLVEDWEKEAGDSNIYQYKLDVETTNAPMTIERAKPDIPYRLRAITSNGRIYGELDNLAKDIDKKSHIDGASLDYDPNKRHVDLKLRTTNGSIYLK